jgi:hypothetical protein
MDGAQPFGLVRDGAVGVSRNKVADRPPPIYRQAAQARRGTSATNRSSSTFSYLSIFSQC